MNDYKQSKTYKEFDAKINEFVNHFVSDYEPSNSSDTKVIHDPVWGMMMLYPWEQQLLDSPLLQRLRRIYQVGLAVLTYPSAHHSRFEHSLGVVSVVTKMVNNINNNQSNDVLIISKQELYKLRLAALLHDVGHCFFSHLSESVYSGLYEFKELEKDYPEFQAAKKHEVFSYLIITCSEFRQFFNEKIDYPEKKGDSTLLDDIAKMIIGQFLDQSKNGGIIEKKLYLTQMINGQYDADKLDYLRRDSYSAGLALTYDIERFLAKIMVFSKQKDGVIEKHLVIPISGITAVEEMIFSQLMLNSYIYQHQKVLATDAIVKDIIEGLFKNKKLNHPCDFLYYCDDDILGIYSNPLEDSDIIISLSSKKVNSSSTKTMHDIVRCIRLRNLPKRAFALNPDIVSSIGGNTAYIVNDIASSLKDIVLFRQEICEEAQKISNTLSPEDGGNKTIDVYDINISVPRTSVAKDLSKAYVLNRRNEFVGLNDVVRLNDWADAFYYHKWNAYVFARHDLCNIVAISSKIVFERHGIKFDEAKVFYNLRNVNEIKELIDVLREKYKYF